MKLLKLLLSLIVSFQTLNAQVSTEQDLATILMSIGDSVKQATLTPVERYNRFSKH